LFGYQGIGRSSMAVIEEAAQRLDLNLPLREVGLAYRDASRAANARITQRDYYLHSELFEDTFVEFAQRLEREVDDELLEWFKAAQRDALLDNMVLRSDCLDTLAELKSRGLYLSIVSNIDDDYLVPLVERSGLNSLLDHWTSSEEAQSCKPHARFFEVALEKASCSANEVLFVGDSPEHDINGAKSVGMRAVLIREADVTPPLQTGQTTLAPDHEIETLSELKDLVAS
jgi:HAD superfamily hydrolase (TIGR01509 family)